MFQLSAALFFATLRGVVQVHCECILMNYEALTIGIKNTLTFDMIDHNILLHILHHYGIRNEALNLLKNYFTGKKQYCHFKNNDSSLLNIHKGVPQGSILGPLLFILYRNDFICSSDRFDFLMYADDTTLFCTYDEFENIDMIKP